MSRVLLSCLGLFALAPFATVLALRFGPDPVRIAANEPLRARDADYEGAHACRACHPAQHESWARTYHATMTQLPTRDTVLGRFDGAQVEFFGRRATPFERDGKFWMLLPTAGGTREAEVALCVGSNRYQQYFELAGDTVGDMYRRLPILWHAGESRWMHMNGVFLEPDDDNWDAHASSWNDNCVFCHNTAPEPRFERASETGLGKRFQTTVADLGIACEACHGPGETHMERMASPLQRYASADDSDLAIIHPSKVGQAESLALCGQCHSQRLPEPLDRIGEFLSNGSSFRPGDVLEHHVAPITRATPPIGGRADRSFEERFWRDGTARLTAYEYLGVTQSPCMQSSSFTCGSCHVMHSGDIHGNIEPEKRGDAACTQCHEDIARDIVAHTHHDPAGSGSRCLECHMPRIIYGIVDIHRSHRIEVPDVRRDVEAGRPNACTSCHLDRSAPWAANAMREWWGEHYELPRSRPDQAPLDIPEALASLHAGDAVQRAVYARHLGRADAAVELRDKAFVFVHLLVVLADGYPSIRTIARRSLKNLNRELALGLEADLDGFETFADMETRRARVFALLAKSRTLLRARCATPGQETMLSPEFELALERVTKLLDLQSDHVISIGE